MVPNIEGRWRYQYKGFRIEDVTKVKERPEFNWRYVDNEQIIEQKDNFVRISRPLTETRNTEGWVIGAFIKRHTPFGSFWELNIVDYDDNGRYSFTIKKYNKKGKPCVLEGHYTESGFLTGNDSQKPTIQKVLLTRLPRQNFN